MISFVSSLLSRIKQLSPSRRILYSTLVVFFAISAWEIHSVSANYSIQRALSPTPNAKWFKPLFSDPDKAQWVMLIEKAQREGTCRVKWLDDDNYPYGRPVHWSSSFLWLGLLTAKCFSLFTQAPADISAAWGAFWIPPVIFSFGATALFAFAYWAVGAFPALILTAMFVFSPFAPSYVSANAIKHRGTVMLLSEMFLLSTYVFFAANPISAPRRLRISLVVSALSCALAMWISPLSFFPILGAVAVSVGFSLFLEGMSSPPRPLADLPHYSWLLWVSVYGPLSLFLYCVEYFPSNWTLRLEVNNPLITSSVIGGVMCLEWLRRRVLGLPSADKLLIFGASLLSLVPLTLIFGGPAFYSPSDPEFGRFLKFIQECLPTSPFQSAAYWIPVVSFALAFVYLYPKIKDNPSLAIPVSTVLILLLPTLLHSRWIIFEIGIASILLALCFAFPASGQNHDAPVRNLALVLVVFWCAWGTVWTYVKDSDSAVQDFASEERQVFALRSAASTILDDWKSCGKAGTPVVLAAPDTSTQLAYFAGLKTITRIYWENLDGLHAYGAAYVSTDDSACKELCDTRGVDYVISEPSHMEACKYMMYGRPALIRDIHYFYHDLIPGDRGKVPSWLESLKKQPSKKIIIYRVKRPSSHSG